MPVYRSIWLGEDGAVHRRRVRCNNAAALAAQLGVQPGQLLAATPEPPAWAPPWRRVTSRRCPLDLRTWCQEVATLLDAGVPLPEAVQALAEQSASATARQRSRELRERLLQGQALSDALRADETTFGRLLPALVTASERTGQLVEVLTQHADYLAWLDALRARLMRATLYPCLLLMAGAAVLLFLLLGVLPRFAGVFDGLGATLPLGSRVLLDLGRTASEHAGAALGGVLGLALALLAGLRAPCLRRRLWQGLSRLPALGTRWRVLVLARLLRTLGLLLQAGVPLAAALPLARGVVAPPWQAALERCTDDVRSGKPLSVALAAQQLDTPVVRRLLHVAERSGRSAELLMRAATFLDEQIGRWADLATEALSPLLMLAIGLLVGAIIVLMYLPIFQLVELVG